MIGEENVFAELRKGAPKAEPTSIITAVLNALRTLGATRVAVATPYLDEINQQEADYMAAAGFEITNIQGLNLEKDSDMIRVRPEFLADLQLQLIRQMRMRCSSVVARCGRWISLRRLSRRLENLSSAPIRQ